MVGRNAETYNIEERGSCAGSEQVTVVLKVIPLRNFQHSAGVGDHALALMDAGVGAEEEPFSCGILLVAGEHIAFSVE